MKLVRPGLTTGLLPRRTVLFGGSFGPNPNKTPINPHFSVTHCECPVKGKRATLKHFIFRKFQGFAPPLIDRSHDAPEVFSKHFGQFSMKTSF